MRVRRAIAGFWVMMVVAAGGVALAAVLGDVPPTERDPGAQVSAAPSAVAAVAQPARVHPRPSAPRLHIALPVAPPPLVAVALGFDFAGESRSLSAVSAPPRDSRGPPPSSIAHR